MLKNIDIQKAKKIIPTWGKRVDALNLSRFFNVKNYNKVFVIAFSLKALYQPIGKESKSEVFYQQNIEYFTQDSLKKLLALTYWASTNDLNGIRILNL